MDNDPRSSHSALELGRLRERLDAVERTIEGFADEVRSRRLVVVGPGGDERISTAVGDSFAEVRLSIGARRDQVDLVLVAAREPPDGATVAGLEVWRAGDHLGGLVISADP